MLKRVFAFFMLSVFIFLCGCSEQIGKSNIIEDDYNYLVDCQIALSGMPAVSRNIAKGENGYYSNVSKFLYYTDEDTMRTIPLCAKPNCLHESESCNAFIGVPYSGIAYNDGYIYYIITGTIEHDFEGCELYRMKFDGTEKEKLAFFDYLITEWMIHRGYFYYAYEEYESAYDVDGLKSNKSDAYIYRCNLTDFDSSYEVVYHAKEVSKNANIGNLMAFGKKLYFMVTGYSTEDTKNHLINYMRLDLEDFTSEIMLLSDGRMLVYPTLFGDRLVFQSEKNDDNQIEYYSTNFNGDFPELLITVSEYERVFCDGKYLYVDNKMDLSNKKFNKEDVELIRRFKVYDQNIELIDEVYFASEYAYNWEFLPIDDKFFIFGGKTDDGEIIIFDYDKEQLGSINGEWKRSVRYNTEEINDSSNSPGALSDSEPRGSEKLVSLWQKATDMKYGVKDSFQSDGADVEGGFSVRLIWEHEGGTFTAYFPFMEFENEDKAKEYVNTNPYILQKGNIVVNIGVESVPQEVYDMLSSILDGTPIEPIDSKYFSGKHFNL